MDSKKEWFTIKELTDLQLPGLKGAFSTIHRKAKQQEWREQKKTGVKGIAYEYHVSSFPDEAQKALGIRAISTNDTYSSNKLWDMLKALSEDEKNIIVNFIQREGLNSLLRLISSYSMSNQQSTIPWGEFLDSIPESTSDNQNPNAPWVDDKTRDRLKETLIDIGLDRKRISSLIMLFSLPEAYAREILSKYVQSERITSSQQTVTGQQEKKTKAG
ncbi:DNA-binding protein [Leminorella grimontii]|uniref:DNA-binding protein n=1 Tax=Leminorella grimontii TaxID=82981 RepID=UPI0032205D3A